MAVSHSSSLRETTRVQRRQSRQLHFPNRTGYAIPSTRPKAKRSMTKQSTLTQLNYIIPSSYPSDDDDEVSDNNEAKEASTRSKKRRRLSSDERKEDVRQSTLTQWEWLAATNSTDEEKEEEEEDGEEEEGEDDVEEDQADQQLCMHENDIDQNDQSQLSTPESSRNKQDRINQPFSLSPSPTPKETEPEPSPIKPSGIQEMLHCSPIEHSSPIFKTPQKPIRREIPSSQSPPETPLSTQQDSPGQQRTPLQEIPPNILAMLDESPSRRAHSQRGTPSVEDKENVDDTPTKQNSTDFKNPDQSPAVSLNIYSSAPHRRSAPASEPIPPPSTSPPTTPSPAKQFQETLRSSQRSTVDLTQPSPSPSPERASPSPSPASQTQPQSPTQPPNDPPTPSSLACTPMPRPPPPPQLHTRSSSALKLHETEMAFDSQLPQSYMYLSGTADSGDYSPLSTLQDSADVITVSQLLPESMLDSMA